MWLGNKITRFTLESPLICAFVHTYRTRIGMVKQGHHIIQQSFEKNRVVTPATLHYITNHDVMWANQKQQENAFWITRQAGALYDKFERFCGDLIKIGKKIDKTEYSGYEQIDRRETLITSVEKLKKMGAKAKKIATWKYY
jgi:DNA recombination protein RmuC